MSDPKKLKADMQFARLRHDALGTAETLENLRKAEKAYQEETDGDNQPVKEVPAAQHEPLKEEKPKPAAKPAEKPKTKPEPAKAAAPEEKTAETPAVEQQGNAEATEEKKTDSQ
ncbi:hypothetical protein [Siphonobacter aquaeclarae]|uniref:RNA polymerase II elongation factor ELL n=1 Tax=Siphonobacter aquaeclarae TaxID=563176 RepID=A0A1G9T3M9_9BACT|nr:hypothetical protein [Siphonobacter aquaeclarae]SDM41675.1 RNA polymerase II elongation factor ELL [Siphonobacter aquaeclarae]